GNIEKVSIFAYLDNLMHLRLDRITKAQITDQKARHFSEVSEYTDFFDIADYTSKLFGMFTGEIGEIELCCKREIAKTVADRFSENIFITNVTEKEFCFSYKAVVSEALVTFIMNFGDGIKVLKPKQLQDMITNRASEILNIYKN
ncbi:MAG: WYL domain-containing protein, partial [Ruminococcaceae bacterium]|nr:WYL domain-containing protein [Oscillospiraceae bacterium]